MILESEYVCSKTLAIASSRWRRRFRVGMMTLTRGSRSVMGGRSLTSGLHNVAAPRDAADAGRQVPQPMDPFAREETGIDQRERVGGEGEDAKEVPVRREGAERPVRG